MTITIRPDLKERIDEKVRDGEFESADAMVEQALAFFLDYEGEAMDGTRNFEPLRMPLTKGWRQAALAARGFAALRVRPQDACEVWLFRVRLTPVAAKH